MCEVFCQGSSCEVAAAGRAPVGSLSCAGSAPPATAGALQHAPISAAAEKNYAAGATLVAALARCYAVLLPTAPGATPHRARCATEAGARLAARRAAAAARPHSR